MRTQGQTYLPFCGFPCPNTTLSSVNKKHFLHLKHNTSLTPLMSTHGTIASSCERRRLVLQPPLENDAPPISIPEDLTAVILLNLPVKSLLRFRCVCKSWKSLISSSDFVKNHLHRSSTDPNLGRYRLLGIDYLHKLRLSRPLRTLMDNPSSSPPIFDDLSFNVRRYCVIVGSCNGLICWVSFDLNNPNYDDTYYLSYLNPSTRLESRSPCFRNPLRCGESCFTIFGFGYDHLSDNYKSVRIYCDPNAEKVENKTMVKVYTLGRDTSWRKMQSFPFFPSYTSFSYNYFDELYGKFVSGTLNWRADRPDGSLVIVSVDLGNETCGEVSLPPHLVDGYDVLTTCKLWVIGDCLCFSYVLNECQFALWQMKVYGATESWTILLNIPYPDQDFGIYQDFHYYLTPMFMFDNGEALLQINRSGKFILYNPIHNSFKYLDFQTDTISFKETTHIESLVSPFPTC